MLIVLLNSNFLAQPPSLEELKIAYGQTWKLIIWSSMRLIDFIERDYRHMSEVTFEIIEHLGVLSDTGDWTNYFIRQTEKGWNNEYRKNS